MLKFLKAFERSLFVLIKVLLIFIMFFIFYILDFCCFLFIHQSIALLLYKRKRF